ncbi:hypothetical protein CFK39_06010 [Brachybacterium avium]|uniref:Polyketide cyclase / dehydrase and lipid transport n=1 Tax=Brachybacterium avium TaxID=2017485 RepID=A0A220UBQ8_9MICO|nr:hypothetical protein [Brachybacterium avium]ASK65460.1 hypothetical protein CFK39_06010 [Brachybacterium avium]
MNGTRSVDPVPEGTALTVVGGRRTIDPLVARFFAERGWSAHERGSGRFIVETGSLRRTVLLGAFAGSRFRLTALIELLEPLQPPRGADAPETVEVRYRWGAGAGRALGGSIGRARAARRHRETSLALERYLGAAGHSVHARPL